MRHSRARSPTKSSLPDSNSLAPAGAASFAVRPDRRFDLVHARSVPRRSPPYRPLAEVIAEQHIFDLIGVDGTVVGFRFPDYAEGVEVGGCHLHFISARPQAGRPRARLKLWLAASPNRSVERSAR
jgi:alpha-acetolactate decarboxylase